MNYIDGILLALILASVIVGSKKGLIRELMAFVVFFTALIVSVNYIDTFAVWVHDKLGGSPLISAFLSFVLLLAISYAGFKLVGLLFYKVADLKTGKSRDQIGGALIGFLRGWVAVAFLTLLTFLWPMPDKFYASFEASFLGPTIAKTVPLIFEATAKLHPKSPSFMEKVERTLLMAPAKNGAFLLDEDRAQIYRVLYQIERFFDPKMSKS